MIGLDGRPKVKDLRTILLEWLEFRIQTVRRRLEFRLEKVLSRLAYFRWILIAYLNIDEVIRIIRHEDNPKTVLMKKFQLSEDANGCHFRSKIKTFSETRRSKNSRRTKRT